MRKLKATSEKLPIPFSPPPKWSLKKHKKLGQQLWDLIGAPLRMIVFPDHVSERFHLTSLRAERLANVLPLLKGRVLDVGAGDNTLLKLYKSTEDNIGVDVVDWNGGCLILPDCNHLPFP